MTHEAYEQLRPYFREDAGWLAANQSTHDTDYFRPVKVPGMGARLRLVPDHTGMAKREHRWLVRVMDGKHVRGVNA